MELYKLSNTNGIDIKVSPFGGVIQSLKVPSRSGELADISLGFDSVEKYAEERYYFGALVGRFGNRIAGGQFILDGELYKLAQNDGSNHLHGGLVGFDRVLWDVQVFDGPDGASLTLRYTSPDGEEGYPGELNTEVTYSLNEDSEFKIHYRATTDKSTHINLTQHTYFNLGGHEGGSIVDHELSIAADFYTPIDAESISTGEILSVEGTVLDFRRSKRIGDFIDADVEQLKLAGGFDHNFVLNKRPGELSHAAKLVHPESGRTVEVMTTEPGIQFYSGNYLDGVIGKEGVAYEKRNALCLETQHFPDTPNKSMFPSTRLDPGQVYDSTTVYKFGVE